MTTTLTRCDACQSTIVAASGRVRLTVEGGTVPSAWPVDSATGRPYLDLCSRCLGRFRKFLEAGPEAEKFELEPAGQVA